MANHVGNEGLLKINGNTIAELKNFTLDQGVVIIDDTTIGDTYSTHKTGTKNWKATADVYWDEGDTAQSACVPSASVTLSIYPEGADSGDTYWTGTATIETWGKKVELNGIITISMAFTGNGALTGPATV